MLGLPDVGRNGFGKCRRFRIEEPPVRGGFLMSVQKEPTLQFLYQWVRVQQIKRRKDGLATQPCEVRQPTTPGCVPHAIKYL